MTAPETAMETDAARGCWQVLPEMRADLAAELAGVHAGLWLTELWHLHRARQAAETGAPLREVTARCRAALALTAERVEVAKLLKCQAGGERRP